MKVLVVNNFFSPVGGAEISSLLTFKALQGAGHQVAFFATDKQPYFIPEYEFAQYFPGFTDFDKVDGLLDKVKVLPKLFFNMDAEAQLKKLMEAFKPEIVLCNNLHYHLTPSILKTCKSFNVPIVMTLRDIRLMCPAGTLIKGDNQYCQEALCFSGNGLHCIQNNCYGQNRLQSALVATEFMFRKLHGLYDSVWKFITPSAAVRDLAIQAGIASEKIVVINNFVENAFFQPESQTQTDKYFLYVGRISQEKGIHHLIEAMSNLPQEVGLHIVGTGPDESVLKKQSEDLDLKNVKFLGHLDGQELIDEYKNCLANVVPSYWFEAFGRTIIEAAALGKPTVGSRIGGIPEVIAHEQTGLLFSPGNANELSQCLLRLYENPDYTHLLGKQACERAQKSYSLNAYIEQLSHIMNAVCQENIA